MTNSILLGQGASREWCLHGAFLVTGEKVLSSLLGVVARRGRNGSRDILEWLWFSCRMEHCGRGFISVFQEFSASIGKAFILAGGWAVGFHFMEFRHFPDFSLSLRS